MTGGGPLQHRDEGRVKRSRVLRFAPLGSLIVTLASSLAYLGALVWDANWPAFNSDGVERVVKIMLRVFILAWIPVGSLTRLVPDGSRATAHTAVALSLWTAWCSVGPIRTMSLTLFALAALLLAMLVPLFMRAERTTQEEAGSQPKEPRSDPPDILLAARVLPHSEANLAIGAYERDARAEEYAVASTATVARSPAGPLVPVRGETRTREGMPVQRPLTDAGRRGRGTSIIVPLTAPRRDDP